MRKQGYWTLVIPYVSPSFATGWHPTESTGPFATLTRGAYRDKDAAIIWAQTHLNGTPYEVRFIPTEYDPEI